ncbi:esterase-like activity of phytase-domain-containing protein [Xylariaceae sp. FL1019]|nr:esterase-like activity of phytase-domain-containing protein [Xylariaceae sp. FL1019]
MARRAFLSACLAAGVSAATLEKRAAGVNSTTCNGANYVYQELAGYGRLAGNSTDKFGDTLGGIGSSIHLDQTTWKKHCNGSYSGLLWAIPDRGWNTEGTLNFESRIHKFQIILTPQPNATVSNPSGPNLQLSYLDSLKLHAPDGVTPTTGIDGDATGHLSYEGFPILPKATYTGDGFGGDGPGGVRIPVDSEGLVVNADGTFWISDEYGPYVYLFGANGTMLVAIEPPASILPMRNGEVSFSADSPPIYDDEDDDVDPADPDTGRENNAGFEGLTVSPDGQFLYVLLQAATVQEGGLEKQTKRYTRFLKYDISSPLSPVYTNEYVLALPLYNDPTAKASKNPKVAGQSEIHALPNGQFFVLSRDSSAGRASDSTLSVYRQIDVFDIEGATDIKADYDCADAECAFADADTGVLQDGITTVEYCPFLDFNVNSQLNRFGVHNGGVDDINLLNEKWESIAMAPVNPDTPNGEYFVISLSDNDFITQNGFMNGGAYTYADSTGFNLDNQALAFRITIS